jgi:diguanylate cyclase
MAECSVPATPENFELFYAHASGEAPAIAQVMDKLIAARTPLTADMLLDLRLRCLSSARAARAMDNLGSGIGDVIGAVLGKLEAAGRETVDYQNTLSAAALDMDQRAPADLKALVGGLLTATREMERRTRSLESELQRSGEQVRELRSKLDNVRKESLTDPLTGIANRKAFDDAVARAQAQMASDAEDVTLLLCDIDHFKSFNDTWGHQTGDQVLRLVANCLAENVKGRDTAARYGGEEFAVLLRGTGLEAATRVAEQIRHPVETKKLVKKSTGDVLGVITISIGVAQFAPGETAETAIRRADSCLYGAKSHGRNMVVNQDDARVATLESSAA